jgi:hypothetical protein
MRRSLTISLLACGILIAGSVEAKPVHTHHGKPAARRAATVHAEDAEYDGWAGPVPRTQRGSRRYGHGIGWSVSPDGYYVTPGAPVYHNGTVTPGHAFDGY